MMFFRLALLLGLLPLACGISQAASTKLEDCAECPVMVSLPAGTFMMGMVGDPAAVPVHEVKLGHSFAIGQTEVTEAQFRYFVKRTGYNAGESHATPSFLPQLPAIEVDWFAAQAYVRWLSRHTGQRYRLPTEAEWDYAAHAGKSSRYWWGATAIEGCGKEHLSSTFFPFNQPCASTPKSTLLEVASLRANPWGLFDMQGNAGEWMQDCWNNNYKDAPTDGGAVGGCDKDVFSVRVVRGPDFLDNAAPRRPVDAREHSVSTGFRVVRELP